MWVYKFRFFFFQISCILQIRRKKKNTKKKKKKKKKKNTDKRQQSDKAASIAPENIVRGDSGTNEENNADSEIEDE
jgi:hypothetical protein